MGGLQAVRAPYFPANALLITRPDNLSIYWQEDTRRRSVIDNPKRDRIENFESVNEAYVVEDYRCAALVENIQMGISARQLYRKARGITHEPESRTAAPPARPG
nr:phage major capsid protein, P2 family [Klebsiella pneumoniae]